MNADSLLTLRKDLVFTPESSQRGAAYLVEDPLTSRFFRIGYHEYLLISLLDGRTTLADARRRLSTTVPEHRLSEADCVAAGRWLAEAGLIADARQPRPAGVNRWTQCNPLAFRVPLGSPDALLARWTPWLRACFSTPACLVWLIVVAWSAGGVFSQWDRFVASGRGIFEPGNWLWLAACWIGLKLVHEMAHGVACQRLGGVVREAGVFFVLFMPQAYVDVTSSWRFRSRWQRIQVAAAGVYAELFLGAMTAMVWSRTDAPWLSHLSFNVTVMATATTLAFNANPLMRFDGYFILCDLLKLPNLSVSGQQWLSGLGRRVFLGARGLRREQFVVRLYAVSSLVWRVLMWFGLCIGAINLLHALGVLLAIAGTLCWLAPGVLQLGRECIRQADRWRFTVVVGSAVAMITVLLVFVPWPGASRAPLVVDYVPCLLLRASADGFVRQVHVCGGQQVESGQVLLILENEDLKRVCLDLELALEQSLLRARKHAQRGELARQQAEQIETANLEQRLTEKRACLEELTVRAPAAGIVIGRHLDALEGTWLSRGDAIVSLGDENQKELRLAIAQEDVNAFTSRVGQSVLIDLPGRSVFHATLTHVAPQAGWTPIDPALSASNGGPLPIDTTETNDGKLFAPQFLGLAMPDGSLNPALRAGQTGYALLRPRNVSLGQKLFSLLELSHP